MFNNWLAFVSIESSQAVRYLLFYAFHTKSDLRRISRCYIIYLILPCIEFLLHNFRWIWHQHFSGAQWKRQKAQFDFCVSDWNQYATKMRFYFRTWNFKTVDAAISNHIRWNQWGSCCYFSANGLMCQITLLTIESKHRIIVLKHLQTKSRDFKSKSFVCSTRKRAFWGEWRVFMGFQTLRSVVMALISPNIQLINTSIFWN